MDEVIWFQFRSRLHALNPDKRGFISYCGLSPANVDAIEAFTEPGDWVPEPTQPVCRKCVVEVGLRSVDEEPLDVAIGRGYLPLGAQNF